MNTSKFLPVALATAALAMSYLPAERLSAQGEGENAYSPSIEMVVDAKTTEERHRTSQNGVMGPVSLRPDERIEIALASAEQPGDPVTIAPLDGGDIIADNPLTVDTDRMVYFTFEGGNWPGLYRVAVTIGSKQYRLLFFVVRPEDSTVTCGN